MLIAILAFAREGWTCLLKLRYWVFIALLTGTTYVYGSFITEVNSVSFHEWTTGKNLAGFLGGKASRLDWRPYARSASYVVVLVLGPAAAGVAAVGLARMFRKRRAPLYICWALSLVFFYLVWGPGTSFAHSYYNLPALPVACAAFGIGASLLVARARAAGRHPAHWTAAGIVALLLVGGAFGSLVLFWPDRSAADGAAALRRIMAGREGFVFCYPNHTAYGPGYTHYTTLFYYAGARGWNENPKWTTSERRAILAKCRWVIELRYDPVRQFPLRERTFFSYRPRNLLDTRAVRAEASFRQVLEAPAYRIWERDGTPLPQPP
ncbi:MAG: hypothetical protein IT578_00700 [Verrucomicrobiae bacterium]|nr:hypothetical protein [Verrucomicrobiae bacterium]